MSSAVLATEMSENGTPPDLLKNMPRKKKYPDMSTPGNNFIVDEISASKKKHITQPNVPVLGLDTLAVPVLRQSCLSNYIHLHYFHGKTWHAYNI